MQPLRFCNLWGRKFEETFENAQWRKVKQTCVILHPLWQAIILKYTVEKSQSNIDEEFWALKRNTIVIGLIGILIGYQRDYDFRYFDYRDFDCRVLDTNLYFCICVFLIIFFCIFVLAKMIICFLEAAHSGACPRAETFWQVRRLALKYSR